VVVLLVLTLGSAFALLASCAITAISSVLVAPSAPEVILLAKV
jgi:hypothetical protein